MSEKPYNPIEAEARWQAYWQDNKTFAAKRTPGRQKRYVLDMFPYPSGAGLHVGHPEGYTATDILARYWRMTGIDVLHPMGWDAFGLPAEQHAIKTGTHPSTTTATNITTFRRQLKSLGFSYDWDREVDTTNADYVRWTQWIFLQLFKRGLAYQDDKVTVNWCPALGTVLANEEIVDGKSERGAHPIVRTRLRQWMLRITAYADRLAEDLVHVKWPTSTLTKQREWIGRSEGAEIAFGVDGHEGAITVFTTRPDTLFGVTYVTLAPEHALVAKITTAAQKDAVNAYVKATQGKSELDRKAQAKLKTGVFTGAFAVHPLTGVKVPIWLSDYVLASYGTGAVMAVPGHDERDFEFAKQFDLPIIEVVSPDGKLHGELTAAFVDDGVSVNSGDLSNLSTADMKARVVERLVKEGRGKATISYKLRDWVFSRQRYWGEPIPVYFPVDTAGNPRNGDAHTIRHDQPIAVEESELPLTLPDLTDFQPGEDPAGPLARALDWRFFQKDGKWYARETNTMPQWAGSCWYYLRFLDPRNTEEPWSEAAYDAWMPVDLYVGGAEHAVLHLLYARFWHKVLFDIGKVKHAEPFTSLVHQGLILGEDGEKMSKSRGNVASPDDITRVHGADALRMYEMFMGPLEAMKPWQVSQVSGVVRFRDRAFALCTRPVTETITPDQEKLLHRLVKKVTQDIEALGFNTAISAMMTFVNDMFATPEIPRVARDTFILLLSPFAPHIGEELWQLTGHEGSLAYVNWPTWNEALCVDDTIEMAVQVNGKVRGRVVLARDASEADAKAAALAADGVSAHTGGKPIKKFIYVPTRIINFVV